MPKNRRYKPLNQRSIYFYDQDANGGLAYLMCPYHTGLPSTLQEVLPAFELESVQRQALVQLLEQWIKEAKAQGLPTAVIEHMLAQNRYRLEEVNGTLGLYRRFV